MATSTTFTHLRTFDGASVAFLLVLPGYDLAYTTSEDRANIEAALNTGTGGLWTTVKGGLDYPGVIGSALDMFDAKIDAPNLSLTVLDADDALIGLLAREADETVARAELVTSVDSNDTTLTLADVSSFASSGTAYCGNEQIPYTSKTGTTNGTLNGCTRGKRSLFYTNSGAANEFGQPHRVDTDLGETGVYRPLVTAGPRNWYNREVALYLLHKEGGSTWSAPGPSATKTAQLLWVGRLKNWEDLGDGRIRLDTVSVMEKLTTTLLADQYKGKVAEGIYLTEKDAQFRVTASVTTTATPPVHLKWNSTAYVTLPGTGGYVTHAELASSIDDQLSAWFNASPGTDFPSTWRMTLVYKGGDSGLRYEFELNDSSPTAGATYKVDVFLSPAVWRLLGWPLGAERAETPAGHTVDRRALEREAATSTWHLQAPDPPQRFAVRADPAAPFSNLVVTVTATNGVSFVTQGSIPASMNEGSPTGFLRIGSDLIVPVKVLSTSGDDTTFSICGMPVGSFLLKEGYDNQTATTTYTRTLMTAPDDLNAEDLTVEQVWCESGPVGEIMLKLLASTGTSGYNHATYDYFPAGMGAGIPWTLLDEVSWLNLGRHDYLLLLEKPTPLRTLIESALKVLGHYCVFKDGKISLVTIGEEWSGATRLVALTESNKAMVVKDGRESVTLRSRVTRSPEGLINRMTLRFNRTLDGKFNRQVTVNARSSQTDFGQVKANVIDAIGFYEINGFIQSTGIVAWQSDVAATALAYFSRPLATVERTYDFQAATRLFPGARVSMTDNVIVDSTDGTRGVSSLLGWCVEAPTDWSQGGIGNGKFVYSPELAGVRLGSWGPSGRVDDTYTSGGFTRGYDPALKQIKLKQHEYSETTEDKDVTYFSSGDKVRVVRLDPTHCHSFDSWSDTINATDEANDLITLTTGLSGFPTGAGYFVIEFDDATTSTAGQRSSFVYLAAPTTLTTGVATRDAKLYGAKEAEKPSTAVSYTGKYQRHRLPDDDQGEPFSVHKIHELMDFANAALGGYHAPQPARMGLAASASQISSTSFQLIVPPVFVVLRSPKRTIRVSVSAKVDKAGPATADGDATLRVRGSLFWARCAAAAPPWSVTFLDGDASYVDLTVDNAGGATNYQQLSGDLVVIPSFGGRNVLGTWITVEGKTAVGTDRLYVRHVSIREKEWT